MSDMELGQVGQGKYPELMTADESHSKIVALMSFIITI